MLCRIAFILVKFLEICFSALIEHVEAGRPDPFLDSICNSVPSVKSGVIKWGTCVEIFECESHHDVFIAQFLACSFLKRACCLANEWMLALNEVLKLQNSK